MGTNGREGDVTGQPRENAGRMHVTQSHADLRRMPFPNTILPMLRTLVFPGAFFAAVAASSFQSLRSGHAVGQSAIRQDTLGFYTEEQAVAGQAVFAKVCSECHESKDVAGGDFRTKWSGQTVYALFEQIRTTMPDGNPGSLPKEDYASAVAYILKLNKLPVGPTALGTDSLSLSSKKLVLPPG